MNLNDARVLCELHMEAHGLVANRFHFEWMDSTKVFGRCRAGMNKGNEVRIIFLSKSLVFLNEEKIVEDTILHEIAHALDFIRSGFKWRSVDGRTIFHDWKWKAICMEIGANPERTFKREAHGGQVKTLKRFRAPSWYWVDVRTNQIVLEKYREPKRKYGAFKGREVAVIPAEKATGTQLEKYELLKAVLKALNTEPEGEQEAAHGK